MSRLVLALAVFFSIFLTQPLNATSRLALGLAPLDRGLSLWYTGEKTWIGIELNRFELSSNKEVVPNSLRNYASPEPPWSAVDHLTRQIHAALTLQRLLSSRSLAPFAYLRFYANLNHEEWENYYHDNWTDTGPELGFGFSWRPLPQVSLILRQGIALEANDRRVPIRLNVHDRVTMTIRLQEARLIALLHF